MGLMSLAKVDVATLGLCKGASGSSHGTRRTHEVLDEIVYAEPRAGIRVRGLIEFMLTTVGAKGAF